MQLFHKILIALFVICFISMGYIVWRRSISGEGMQENCIFCKIIAHQIPATIIAENNDVIVIKDIHPKAPTHLLIIPKKHIQDIQSFTTADRALGQSMLAMAQQLSKAHDNQHFRLVVNSGKDAGQKVFHVHMHYLAGEIHHDDV